jgi:RNA polymerase sigma-70 factor (ECF subfamily)
MPPIVISTEAPIETPLATETDAPGFTVEQFAPLQASLQAPLRRFARRTLGLHIDDDTIDDIVQDTLIALYKRLLTDDVRVTLANARPYAFGIARNLCYQRARRARRENISLEDDRDHLDDVWSGAVAVAAYDDVSPEDAAYWMLLNLEVQAALEKLPAVHRQVLLLYSEEGMAYDEIAVVMATSIGTVKSRLHYAKKMLRAMLRRETLDAIETGA